MDEQNSENLKKEQLELEKEKQVQLQLNEKYKKKGAQQLSLEEYLALQKKKNKSTKKLPAPLQFILATPFLIIFCFGIFFLPYLIYLIFTSPSADAGSKNKNSAQEIASSKSSS